MVNSCKEFREGTGRVRQNTMTQSTVVMGNDDGMGFLCWVQVLQIRNAFPPFIHNTPVGKSFLQNPLSRDRLNRQCITKYS